MSDIDLPLAVRMMQDGYLMEIQDLKEKNKQLRKERDFYFQQVTDNGERAHGAIDTLNAENAKLRELVRIAINYCDTGTCDGCPIQGESGSCPYSDMARELGIEVD